MCRETNWTEAIERNRLLLLPIIARIFVLLGLEDDGRTLRLPQGLRSAALRLLRPAESAVRRLIVIAARGVVVKDSAPRPAPAKRIAASGLRPRQPSFQLFDPRSSIVRVPGRRGKATRIRPRIHLFVPDPRIAVLWRTAAAASAPAESAARPDDGLVSGARLARRLVAVKFALDDIPRQARRLARWQARRQRAASFRHSFSTPLRTGRPPGHRAVGDHLVDDILSDCHRLALEAQRGDTS